MNTKFEVGYIPDDDSGTIRVKSISLSQRGYVNSPDGSKTLFINEGALYYTSSFKKHSIEILCIGATYTNGAFHARKRFITKLLKKWNLFSKEVEVPIKIVAKPKVKARPKLKHSSHGIQVDVVRVPQSNDYLVTRVQALHKRDLPLIYTNEDNYDLPRVWQSKDALIMGEGYLKDSPYVLLRMGKTYSYGQLKKALLYIELAGRHLTVANQHMKSPNAKWAGSNWITFKDGLLLKDTTFQNRNEVDLGTVDISEGFKDNFWASLIC